MSKPKPAEKAIFERWYVLTDAERIEQGFPVTAQAMQKRLNVSHEAFLVWGRQCKKRGIYPPKKVGSRVARKEWKEPSELPLEMQQEVDARDLLKQGFWTPERIEAVNQAIYDTSIGKSRGNPNSQKLIKQITGELVEKKEVSFVLSADDYFRIRREAQSRIRELTGERDRDRGVQPESTLLLSEDGISSEQEHVEDGEVAAVGLSS